MPASATFAPQLLKGGAGWTNLRIGAGGYVTGIEFDATGNTVVVRTDVGSAYVAEAPDFIWRDVLTTSALPSGKVWGGVDYQESTNYPIAGVWEIAISPSNPNRLYMGFAGYTLRSDDKGHHWTLTTLARFPMNGNASEKFSGPKIAVDPLNPDVVYVGTTGGAGVQRSMDGGTTWAQVSAVSPAGPLPLIAIAIDASSASTGSGATLRKSKVHFASSNNGLYTSTNGGDGFTLANNTLTDVRDLIVDSAGTVIATSLNGQNAKRWKGGVLDELLPSPYGTCAAVDPANRDRVVGVGNSGPIGITINATAAVPTVFSHPSDPNQNQPYSYDTIATDVPWLDKTKVSVGRIRFRPGQPRELWMAMGVGVFRATAPDTFEERFQWHSVSAGIEEMVAKSGLSIPGRPPLLLCWDRPLFRIVNPAAYPKKYQPTADLSHGQSADYAMDNLDYVALCSNHGLDTSSYSYDGGRNFKLFANSPLNGEGYEGGYLAVRNAGEVWFFPGQSHRPRYTLDNGQTPWNVVTNLGGNAIPPDGTWNGFGAQATYYLSRQIATDKTNGDMYLYNFLGSTNPLGGIWRQAAGTLIWTKQNDTSTFGFLDTVHCKLESVPGKGGHLFLTGGASGSDGQTNPADTNLLFSKDQGVTFLPVPGVKEAEDVRLSEAGIAAGGYPAVSFLGWYNGVYGTWECRDFNPNTRTGTWVNRGLPDVVDHLIALVADRNIPSRLFIGTKGHTWFEYNPG